MQNEWSENAGKESFVLPEMLRAGAAAALLVVAGWGGPIAGGASALVLGPSAAIAQTGRTAPVAEPMKPLMHLDVNLPAYQLDVFLRNERVRGYRIAIGMPGYRTPRGIFEVAQLQWNPWWIPPRKEWAKNERVTPPGPTNPMGKVKLPFSPAYLIHGTPDEASLGKPSSHGCVRLANRDAIDFATLIQRAFIGPVASDSVLGIVIPRLRPTTVKLHEPIFVEIRYDLADVVADTLFVYPDPYRLGTSPSASARAALVRAGLDTTAVDFADVRQLKRYPARIPVALRARRPPWP
jgi:hypothetical protein